MGDLLKQIEQWNDDDEFSQCIEAIEAIPENERGYKLTLLLGRAYSNLAVLGDHSSNADDDEVDQEMLSHAIELLRSIEDQGKDDPLWNARMANAYWMMDGMEATAFQYAQRWLELEPSSESAQNLVNDCEGYIAHTEQEAQNEVRFTPEMYDEADWDAVEEHIETYFGSYEQVMHEMVSPDIHLDICLIPPRKDHDYYTLVTMGMGAHKMDVPDALSDRKLERAELLINLPPDWQLSEDAWKDEKWYWPIEVLKWCARYPVNNPDAWLGWGHTVTAGEKSFAKSTKLCGVMLLNPGVFGEPSFFCSLPGGDSVNFYQLVPLYKEEMDFKIENGAEELLSKCPDELLEVIDPSRLNAITDEETIGYDEALMNNAENGVAVIREKQLPVEELAAYNDLAIYLRWCMEHDQMSNPFLAKYQDVVDAVKAGNGFDLRVFIRDSEDLQGKLSLIHFNREGAEFAQWYSWGSRTTPYSYAKDIDTHARAYFGNERYESAEFQDEAYLFVPWNEQYYQEISEIIDGRFAEWKNLDENQEPEKDLAIKPGELKELLQGWDGPRDCFATDRIVVDGCRIGSCYREVADRTDQGWDSGWRFMSGDEDDEYMDADEHFGIYDLNTLCNFDPDIIPFLSMPAGTWLERSEGGTFQEVEDDEECKFLVIGELNRAANPSMGEILMKLNSKKYPNITYEKGEEIFLSPEEANSSFYFDVEEELTSNDEAMAVVAAMLDEVDTLIETAKDYLKKTLADEKSEYHGTVAYFMEYHRDEMDPDTVAELFPVDAPSTIPYIEMVDYLKINRFGSLIDNKSKQQAFIMDLSFNPELTDELMVIYFNLEKQVYYVTHES